MDEDKYNDIKKGLEDVEEYKSLYVLFCKGINIPDEIKTMSERREFQNILRKINYCIEQSERNLFHINPPQKNSSTYNLDKTEPVGSKRPLESGERCFEKPMVQSMSFLFREKIVTSNNPFFKPPDIHNKINIQGEADGAGSTEDDGIMKELGSEDQDGNTNEEIIDEDDMKNMIFIYVSTPKDHIR